MFKTDLRYIAEDLVEELREIPDGTEITSGQMLEKRGYDLKELGSEDLSDYHEDLLRAAKANHITLHPVNQDNRDEGLPWKLGFVVHNKKAQIKCPYCGSVDTARILYGKPALSDELQVKIDAGKIRLGGCRKNTVWTEDGSCIELDPKRCCNRCGKRFARPAYWQNRGQIASYIDMVESIEYEVGGFFEGHTGIRIRRDPKGALVQAYRYSPGYGVPDGPSAHHAPALAADGKQAVQRPVSSRMEKALCGPGRL